MVVENGEQVGYCDLTQAMVGFQFGGQAYREIIFLENGSSLQAFKTGDFEFSAQASAVAATAGAAATADYEGGAAVFTLTIGGLMHEASVGGQ
jgi:lipid-binding SYLF domain-containing protein